MKQLYLLSMLLSTTIIQGMFTSSPKQPLLTSPQASIPQETQQFVELRKICVSPDGKSVAIQPTNAAGLLLYLFDRVTGTCKPLYSRRALFATSVTNTRVYTANKGGDVFLLEKEGDDWAYAKEDGHCIFFNATNDEVGEFVFELAVNPTDTLLFSTTTSGIVNICDSHSLNDCGGIQVDTPRPIFIAFNNDGTLFYLSNKASSQYQSSIYVWNTQRVVKACSNKDNKEKPVSKVSVDSPVVGFEAYGPGFILSAHDDGNVRLWDARNLKKPAIATHVTDAPIVGLHAFGNGGCAVHTLDRTKPSSKVVIVDTLGYTSFDSKDLSAAYAYDKANNKLIAASGDREITVIDPYAIKKCEQ